MVCAGRLVFSTAFAATLEVHQQQRGSGDPDNGLHYVHVNFSFFRALISNKVRT